MMRAGFEDGGRWADGVFGDGGRWERQPPKGGCIIVAPGWLAYLGLVVNEGFTAEERLYKLFASWGMTYTTALRR